jgi:RecA-family ATPase
VENTLMNGVIKPPIEGTDLWDADITPPEPDWIVHQLITRGDISLISAGPKCGKSVTTGNLIRSVLEGTPFLGRTVAKGAVLYYSLEEKRDDLLGRFHRLGIAPGSPIRVRYGSLANAMETLKQDLRTTKPILAVIDPVISILPVENAKEYNEVMAAFNRVRALLETTNTHLCGVLHDNKSSQGFKAMIDSQGFRAAPECNIKLEREDENDQHSRRFIYTEQRNELAVAIPRSVLEYDRSTSTVTLGGEVKKGKKVALEKRILDALKNGSPMTKYDLHEALGGDKTATVASIGTKLSALKSSGQVMLAGKNGQTPLYTLPELHHHL